MIKLSWEGSASAEGDADDLVKLADSFMGHLARIVRAGRVDGAVTKIAVEGGLLADHPPDTYDSRHESPFEYSTFNPGGEFSAGRRGRSDAPTIAPDAPWAAAGAGVPDSGGPVLPPATEEQLGEGADLWLGLITTWNQGFMDEEAEQPDRLTSLAKAVTEGGGLMFAVLAHYGGLTLLVRSLTTQIPKKRARRIAENIAQVASAAGIPVIADYLEYTKEYLGEEYHND